MAIKLDITLNIYIYIYISDIARLFQLLQLAVFVENNSLN
jgi:hypothetical protein